jgi:hypothetical protein
MGVAMKATIDQVEAVRQALTPLDTPERRARYMAGDFPNADRVRDLDTRYRWDTYYLAVDSGALTYDTLRNLNGAHTETVLRKVVPALSGGGK